PQSYHQHNLNSPYTPQQVSKVFKQDETLNS
ncbi:unnamed protein product, partial [Rotaria socialis]